MSKWHLKKDVKNPYDPQIAAAAQANARVAARAQEFSEQFYTDEVSPLLQEMKVVSEESRAQQGQLFDLNYRQAQLAADRYETYGIPAEERYYQMVSSFNEPSYRERYARQALGDTRVAFGNAFDQMARRNASYGIDPTSGAAISARRDMQLDQALGEVSAMTRATESARNLGIQLTSDAANYGRGGGSAMTQFGSAASGNSLNTANIANQALGSANASAGVPLSGYGLASQAYSSNLSGYVSAGNAAMQANAGAGSGLGNFLGKAAGIGLDKWLSDVRAKIDITLVGELEPGIGWYTFRYKHDPDTLREGVLAQEVLQVRPHAVEEYRGLLHVDYAQLGVA